MGRGAFLFNVFLFFCALFYDSIVSVLPDRVAILHFISLICRISAILYAIFFDLGYFPLPFFVSPAISVKYLLFGHNSEI